MEAESQRILPESSQSSELIQGNNGVIVHHSDLPETYCTLCRRVFSSDEDMNESLETITICGDCKFMFLEDLETTRQNSQESSVRGRRARYNRSSESIEDLFSQQFSHLINLVRQNQHTVSISASEHDQLEDGGDSTTRSLQRTSSRTTPNRSRRWRRALSDNESEGFDNLDSVFGETESNVSFGWYGPFHGESDAVSFSAYGGDSDVSVDGRSFFDRQMFIQPDDGSDIDSDTDTDIDPMHAGLNQWNSDDQDEEDGEWEEADAEENTFETTEAEGWIQDGPENWGREIQSPEHVPMIRWRTRESRRTYTPNIFTNSEESEVPPYVGNSGDYLDGRSFEELLEQLAEADISRRGAPPAATSFVDTLPRLIINEEHGKHGDLVCAVCKDTLSIGSEVSQLPCLHLYHPSCILPWLSSRNSCPLCRYELPTDDRDYEERKWNTRTRMAIREIPQQDPGADSSSSDSSVDTEVDEAYEVSNGRRIEEGELGNVESSNSENTRGRWFFLAAAPIVSVVGVVLILWLRNPRGVEGRGGCGFRERGQQQAQAQARSSGSSSSGANRNRRWWSLF